MSIKRKIIQDSNRDLKGFANEKQQRFLIIQNQQYKDQLEKHSKNITNQLQKNQKLQQQIRSLKNELQLHKQIQADLVKRSSLAQTVIKKLQKEITQLKKNNSYENTADKSLSGSPIRSSVETNRAVSYSTNQEKQEKFKLFEQQINQLKVELANAKNYNHYMENMQKVYSKKYQTLGSIMANYLQSLLYNQNNEHDHENQGKQLSLNISQLKNKNLNEWKFYEIEAVLQLLFTQIKPFFSVISTLIKKNSLISFPEPKSVNISFIEEAPKQVISLPKIIENYEKSYDKQAKKGQNRFKDIPIDISTKILRSNLRQWGSKIKYGNMPLGKIQKSKSIIEENSKNLM